jgi:hypothetical protein
MKKDTRLVLCEASGPLKTLIDNLSGNEGELWLTALKRMLRKESPFARDWQIWKTIQTRVYSSIDVLYNELEKRGDVIFRQGGITTEVSETLNLVLVTVEELGFSHGANIDAIYKQAQLLGLSLCPSDLPWQLRLHYVDQPQREDLNIAVKTFKGGLWGGDCINALGHLEELGVGITECDHRGVDNTMFRSYMKFVFCLRK